MQIHHSKSLQKLISKSVFSPSFEKERLKISKMVKHLSWKEIGISYCSFNSNILPRIVIVTGLLPP